MATFMNESIIIGSDRGTSRGPWPGVALLLALALVALASWALLGRAAPTQPVLVPAPLASSTVVTPKPVVSLVKLAFLDASGEGEGEPFGCDTLALVEVPVAPTADPVTAALTALFAPATTTDLAPGNFVADQLDLAFAEVEVHEDDIHVNLVGAPTYAGVCDDPRLQIQIEQTVRANAPDVDEVEIFLNGEEYQQPNEKGEEE